MRLRNTALICTVKVDFQLFWNRKPTNRVSLNLNCYPEEETTFPPRTQEKQTNKNNSKETKNTSFDDIIKSCIQCMFTSHCCNLPVLQVIKYGQSTPSLINVIILCFKHEISQNGILRTKCKTRCFKHFGNRSSSKQYNLELRTVFFEAWNTFPLDQMAYLCSK